MRIASFLSCLLAGFVCFTAFFPAKAQEEPVFCMQQEHTHSQECDPKQQAEVQNRTEEGTPDLSSEALENQEESLLLEEQTLQAEDALECTFEEHVHDLQCYSNLDADLVSAKEMESLEFENPKQAAHAFLGYAQSSRNYQVDEQGNVRGYSKFGAFFDQPYAEWNVYFAKYIYMQTQNPAAAYLNENPHTSLENLKSAWVFDQSSITAGDLVFFENKEGALLLGIAVNESFVIAGDIDGRVERIGLDQGNVIAAFSCRPAKTSFRMADTDRSEESAVMEEEITVFDTEDAESSSGYSSSEETGLLAYITKITVYTTENGVWTPVESVTNGSPVMAKIDFDVPNGVISESNRTFTYQLPDGFSAVDNSSGKIEDHQRQVGTFTVSADGLITVEFYKDFASSSEGFSGNLKVTGMINEDNDKTHTIVFSGSGTGISVEPHSPLPDLSVDKTGVYNSLEGAVSYTVTIYSENGTGGQSVSVIDGITSYDGIKTAAEYDFGSLKVQKVLANGNVETVTGYSEYRISSTEGPGIYLMKLPALQAEEEYILHYSLPVSLDQTRENGKLTNKVYVYSGKISAGASHTAVVDQPLVRKSGEIDTVNKAIDWKIELDPGGGNNLQGAVLNDELPEGMQLVPDGVILVTNGSGQIIQTASSFPFVLDTDSTTPLTVTFQSTLGNLKPGQSAVNEAVLTVQRNKNSAEAKVTLGEYGWDIKKEFVKAAGFENGIQTYEWKVSSYLNDTPVNGLSISDTIHPLTDGSKTAEGSQYVSAGDLKKQLQESLQLQIKEGEYESRTVEWDNDLGIVFSLTCKDAKGNIVENDSDQAVSFTLSVSAPSNLFARYLSMEYKTSADMNSFETSKTITVKNTAEKDGVISSAKTTYTVPAALTKSVLIPEKEWVSGSQTLSYEQTKGELKYRIIVPVNSAQVILVTDTLNTSLKLKTLQAKIAYSSNDTQESVNGISAEEFIQFTEKEEDGKTVVDFTIDGAALLEQTGQPVSVILEYSIDISADPAWKDPLHLTSTYENTAASGDESVQTSTTISRAEPQAVKYATYIGQPDSVYFDIQYDVIINPGAEKLSQNGILQITDRLDQVDGVQALLNPESVKVFEYDPDSPGRIGAALDPKLYSYTYNGSRLELKLQLPDEMKLVLVYEYRIANNRSVPASLVNRISINGKDASSSQSQIEQVGLSGVVERFELSLYKVQSDDYNIRLADVPFALEQYDVSSKTWNTLLDSLKTDSQGKIVLTDQTDLQANVLYRFAELEYPKGYTHTDQGDQYSEFVISEPSALQQQTKQALLQQGIPESLLENVYYANTAGGTMYVENKKTELQLTKIWLDEYGDTLDASRIPVESVTFSLLSSTQKDISTASPVESSQQTLDASNNWGCSWKGLPEENEQGEKLYYFIQEESGSDQWQSSSINNTGDRSGSVTFMNKLTGSAALPQTGNKGFYKGTLLAAALLFLGVLLFAAGRKGETK